MPETKKPCTPGWGYPTSEGRCIDVDAPGGVSIREHKGTGSKVFMYKAEPGVYLNVFGDPISEQMARECGFPVEEHRAFRLRAQKLVDAASIVDAELSQPTVEAAIVSEAGGFRLLDLGFNRYIVETSEHDKVTPAALTRAAATAIFTKLAGAPSA